MNSFIERRIVVAMALVAVAGCSSGSIDSDANLAKSLDGDDSAVLHDTSELGQKAVYIGTFSDLRLARKVAISYHHALLESDYSVGQLTLELTPSQKRSLEQRGVTFVADNTYFERLKAYRIAQAAGQKDNDTISGYPCYETVEGTADAARALAAKYPKLVELLDVGDSWAKSAGKGGYDLQVLRITNRSIEGDKPKLMVHSAMHAREYATAPLNLAFARDLLEKYGVDADATWIVDHQETHLLFQLNPDGRKQAETGIAWRKNANESYCGATSNSRGADLNRNFSFTWNATNGSGSSGQPCSDTFRGPTAGSEPETKAIEQYARSIFKDRRGPGSSDAAPRDTSGVHIDLHSYSELVLWPWGESDEPAPNAADLQRFGRKLAFLNGYYPQQSVGLYATDGTSDALFYGELGIPSMTIELGSSFFQRCGDYDTTVKPGNMKALWYAARVARAPYLWPAGAEIVSLEVGPAVAGKVELRAKADADQFSKDNGEEVLTRVAGIDYFIDELPWTVGARGKLMAPTDGRYNTLAEGGEARIDVSALSKGRHTVYVRAKDAKGNWGPPRAAFIDVVD